MLDGCVCVLYVHRNQTNKQDWVSKSMDRHKAELRSVLFPIFVHCYFGLVKYCDPSDSSNQADMPRRFLQRWGPEHQLHYRDEVTSLQSITLAEHLDTHDYAKLLLAVDPVMPFFPSSSL